MTPDQPSSDADLQQEADSLTSNLVQQQAEQRASAKGELEAAEQSLGVQKSIQQEATNGSGSSWNFDAEARDDGDYSFADALSDEIKGDIRGIGRGIVQAPFKILKGAESLVASTERADTARFNRLGRPDLAAQAQQRDSSNANIATQADAAGSMYADMVAPQQKGVGEFAEKATTFGLDFAALPSKVDSVADIASGAPAASRFVQWAVPKGWNTLKAGAAGAMDADASQGETASGQFAANAKYAAATELGVSVAGQAVRLYKWMRGLDATPKIPLTDTPGTTAGDGSDTTVPVTQAERRTPQGAADRARIDALPADEQSGEITKLRQQLAAAQTEARTDSLTGLPNRRAFDEATASDPDLTHFSIDSRKFGAINKAFGDEVGDQSLKRTADVLQEQVGAAGTVFRRGGEEFAVLTKNPQLVKQRLDGAGAILDGDVIHGAHVNGGTATRNGLGFDYGFGADEKSANIAMRQAKAARAAADGDANSAGYIDRQEPSEGLAEGDTQAVAEPPKPELKAAPTEPPVNPPITPEDIQGKRYGNLVQIEPAHAGAFMQFMAEGALSDAMKLAKVNGAYLTPEVLSNDTSIRSMLRGVEDEIQSGTDSFGTNYRIPDNELAKFAQQTGTTPEQLMKLHQDVKSGGGLAARLFATGAVPQVLAKRASDAAKAAVADDSSDNIAAAFQSIYEAALADSTARASASEVGRALRAARLVKEQRASLIQGLGRDGIDQLMQQVGGRSAVVDKFLSDLAETSDAGQLSMKIRQFNRGSLWTRIQNAIVFNGVNSMISSPLSLGRAVVGNAFNSTWDTFQGLGAMGIGSARRALGADAAYTADTFYNAHITGKWAGLKSAFGVDSGATKDILKAIQEGRVKDAFADASTNPGVGSVYRSLLTGHQAVDTAQQPLDATLGGNPIGDLVTEEGATKSALNAVGNVISIPGRLHMANDDLWKEMNVRSALVEHSTYKAEAEASAQGLTGEDFDKEKARLVAQFMATKPDDIADAAMTDARRGTLTDTSKFANNLQKVLTADGKLPIGRLLSPFTRITTNMVRTAARKSPLGFLASDQLAALKAGGAGRDKVLAGMGMSWGLTLGAYEAVSRGLLTGGGPSGSTRENWLLDNKPYTLTLGSHQVDYRSLGAFGLQLGLLADYHEAVNSGIDPASQSDADKAGQVLGAMWVATGRDITSATTLTGVSTFLDALQDESGNKMQKWGRAMADSQIPYFNLGKDLAHDTDPVYRDARSVVDDFKSALPGYSSTLPVKRNVLGEELKVDGKLGPDWLSPISISPTDTDPVHKALADMDKVVQMPPRTLHTYGGGPGVQLSPQQYSDFLEIRGQDPRVFGQQSLSQRLHQLVTSPEWARTPEGQDGIPGGRELEVQKLFTMAGQRAQQLLLQKYPDLKQQLTDAAHRATDVRAGLPLQPQQ